MFTWYQKSAVCYAFSEDVTSKLWDNSTGCRWFTRGFTLQELLAPPRVEFYNSSWQLIGDRSGLAGEVSSVTSIHVSFLRAGDDQLYRLRGASAARKMSWAANRETTRPEDIAYCMLGLFGANMPLLYGEGGTKAFMRLQEQIIQDHDDQSILAWEPDPSAYSGTPVQMRGKYGWAASHPREFKNAANIVPLARPRVSPPSIGAGGLQIHLDLGPAHPKSALGIRQALLSCRREDDLRGAHAIYLCAMSHEKNPQQKSDGAQGMFRCHGQSNLFKYTGTVGTERTVVWIPRDHISSYSHQQMRLTSMYFYIGLIPSDLALVNAHPRECWNISTRTGVFAQDDYHPATLHLRYRPTGQNYLLHICRCRERHRYPAVDMANCDQKEDPSVLRSKCIGDSRGILERTLLRKGSKQTILVATASESVRLGCMVVDLAITLHKVTPIESDEGKYLRAHGQACATASISVSNWLIPASDGQAHTSSATANY